MHCQERKKTQISFILSKQWGAEHVDVVKELNTFKYHFIRLSTKQQLKMKYSVMRCNEMYVSIICVMWRSSKNQPNNNLIYGGTEATDCLMETVAVSTAHSSCLRNLGLKVTPGFSLTLHVTTRRITVVMPQLVGDGRCCTAHHLHTALRE